MYYGLRLIKIEGVLPRCVVGRQFPTTPVEIWTDYIATIRTKRFAKNEMPGKRPVTGCPAR